MPIIFNIKQLGFAWETNDPFLFCVHHLDIFPKGIHCSLKWIDVWDKIDRVDANKI